MLVNEVKIKQIYLYSLIVIGLLACALIYLALLQRRSRKAIENLAVTDALTGLRNRRAIHDIADQLVEESRRYKKPLAMSVIDLDFFKQINDELGHLIGDKVLQQFSYLLQAGVRKSDWTARYGGEEFIVIMPHTQDQEAKENIDRLAKYVEAYNWASIHEKLSLTFSAGVAQYESPEMFEHFYARADTALYDAKRSGRKQCRIYKKENKQIKEQKSDECSSLLHMEE